MADDESKTTFKLDLDATDFVEGTGKALGAITELGKPGSLDGLVAGLGAGLGELALVTAAIEVLKKGFEIAFDADHIKAVNNQFQVLAVNAGVFPEKLRAGLMDASRGWVDQTSLMEAANKAMTMLNVDIDKLPDLMEMARKATAIMGGDFVQNFEAMSQAVATGNMRGLRHLGIKLDMQKAERDYAASIGSTVDILSEDAKQQARMNALLDIGKTKFKGQNEDITATTNTWKVFKTTLIEVGEVITIIFDRVLGPILRTTFAMMNKGLEDVRHSLLATFGIGSEKVEGLKGKLVTLNEELEKAKKAQAEATDFSSAQVAKNRVEALTTQINAYNEDLKKVQTTDKQYLAEQKQHEEQEKVITEGKKNRIDEVADKKVKKEAEYASQKLALDKKILDMETKSMETIDRATELYNRKQANALREIDVQKQALAAKHQQRLISDNAFKEQMSRLNHMRMMAEMKDVKDLETMQRQALDNYVRNSRNAFDGVSRSFHAHAVKAQMDLKNWGMLGDTVFNSMSNNAVQGFEAIGSGAQSAGDAMKGFMLNSLADICRAEGTMLLASAIINPANGVAGAALLVLSGFLRSQAGAAGSKGSSSFGGGGGGGGGAGSASGNGGGAIASTQPLPAQAASQTQQSGSGTQIVVQGSIFDSEATRIRMADLVRAASDSNGFSIQRVGGGV